MKATHISAAALVTSLAVLLAASPARADEPPQPCADDATCAAGVQGARFRSTASAPVIAAEACSLHATLTIDGRPRHVDVQVDGRRCSSSPAPEDVIPLDVRIQQEASEQRVVVEAAPSDVPADVTRSIVVALGRELRSRIERATTPTAPPPPPPPPAIATRVETAAQPTPLHAYDPLWDRPTVKMRSPKMVGWGVAFIVVGGLTMFGGTFGGFTSSSYDHSGAVGGLAAVLVGAGIAGIGIPLVIVGKRQVPVVSASVSPTGGGLRVAF